MTRRRARQVRVSLCYVVSGVGRAAVPGYLQHMEQEVTHNFISCTYVHTNMEEEEQWRDSMGH